MAKAVCTLYGNDATVYGSLVITQAHEDAKSVITGELKGLPAGKHALHVNVFGDVSQPGGVFNPFGKNHGAPEDEERRSPDANRPQLVFNTTFAIQAG